MIGKLSPATEQNSVFNAKGGRASASEGRRVKDWEVIADNLSNADWTWGCVSAIDSNRRTIWTAGNI